MKTSKCSFGTVGFIEREGTRGSLVASVPKGWRLMEDWELLRFHRKNPNQTIFPTHKWIAISPDASGMVGLSNGSGFYASNRKVGSPGRLLCGVAVVKKEETGR